jgi:hypothetical protein
MELPEAPETVTQEVIEPANTTDTGDFGEGTLELEQKILNDISTPADDKTTPEGEAVTTAPIDAGKVENVPVADATKPVTPPTAIDANAPTFDLDGKLSLKAGQPLTIENIKELEKGFLRQRDYTQKTQQVAEVRQAAEEVLTARDQIVQNPMALREHFDDKHILSAFTREEMLNYGLAAAGVPVQAWNQFIEWSKESGYTPENGKTLPNANPYVHQFTSMNQQMNQLGKTVQTLIAERDSFKEQQTIKEREDAVNAEYKRLDGIVGDALKEFPDVEKNDLLIKMASTDGLKTPRDLAKEINDGYERRFNAYVEKKTKTRDTAPKTIKGQSVNIVHRQPKTFAEAEELVDQAYGNGSLKSRT